jgi:hypothetical protein
MNASIRSSVGDAQKSAKNTAQTRSVKLRQMLHSAELEFLMEAHNGLSARIVREAGFKGIWASGLMISAQFGVRDFAYCSRGDGRGLFGTPVRPQNSAFTHVALGVSPAIPAAESSVVLRAYKLSAEWSYGQLHDALKADGFVIYAGQGNLSKSLFRISTMGHVTSADIERLLQCFARLLK